MAHLLTANTGFAALTLAQFKASSTRYVGDVPVINSPVSIR
ncbi:hypothetical protein [Pseudomonas petrae]|nr:hypothetical protein [Pseudomonas petrae]